MEDMRQALILEKGLKDDIIAIVSFSEWYSRLEARARNASGEELETIVRIPVHISVWDEFDPHMQPAIRLLEFFRELAQSIDGNPTAVPLGPIPQFQTKKMEKVSPVVANATQLTSEDARRWVRCWISSGFIN